MNDVLGHASTLSGYTGPGMTCANDMNFVMNHALGVGSVARPVDQHPSILALYHKCPLLMIL